MKTAADCSSGLTLRLDSIKSAGSLHRNGEEQEQEEEQEEEEKQEQVQEQEEGKKDEELEQQTDEGLEGVLGGFQLFCQSPWAFLGTCFWG